MKPRVLFVSRTRYRMPLDPQLARKWDALADQLDFRVLATGAAGVYGRFRLVAARSPVFYLLLPFHVARELRQFRPDVIVTQSPYEAGTALVGRAIGRSDARILLEVHGDWRTATRLYGSQLRRLVEPVSRTAARAAVRRADAVRTVSPYTTSLVRGVGVEPSATFTAFVDAAAFTAGPPVPLPVAPSVLFVGVLERYKNIRSLAAAWRIVAARLPNATLHIVGRGREQPVVEQLVRDTPGSVARDEWIPSEAVSAALDRATVLVLPSFSEGLPRIVVEAFARARGVVATRAGGTQDIVEDGVNGLLVPSDDPQALADALIRVLADPTLAQSLSDGAREASGGWLQSPEQFAARMRLIVDEVRR